MKLLQIAMIAPLLLAFLLSAFPPTPTPTPDVALSSATEIVCRLR